MALCGSLFNILKIAFWTMTPNRKIMIRTIVKIVLIVALDWLVYSSSSLECQETFMARKSDLNENMLMIFNLGRMCVWYNLWTKTGEELGGHQFGAIMLQANTNTLKYRVSHSKEGKVTLLWWGDRFWFLLIFWVLCV